MGVIFGASGQRVAGTAAYQAVAGSAWLSFSGGDVTGSFKVIYQGFQSQALCPIGQSCSCTGTLAGAYAVTTDPSTLPVSAVTSGTAYSPNPTPAPTPAPTADVTSTSTFLVFSPNPLSTNLGPGCPEQPSRTVEVTIFSDETLVLTDSGRDTLFRPRTY
jgi:hypothetical protein